MTQRVQAHRSSKPSARFPRSTLIPPHSTLGACALFWSLRSQVRTFLFQDSINGLCFVYTLKSELPYDAPVRQEASDRAIATELLRPPCRQLQAALRNLNTLTQLPGLPSTSLNAIEERYMHRSGLIIFDGVNVAGIEKITRTATESPAENTATPTSLQIKY